MPHPNPNPASCLECHKIPRSNFSFFGCDIPGWRYDEMPHPNPNPISCSENCKMPRSNFLFLGVTFLVGGMMKCITLTITLKVVQNVTKFLDPTFHF